MAKISPWLLLSCFVTCFGSSMLYGYNISVFNGPKRHIECYLSETLLGISPCPSAADGGNSTVAAAAAAEHRVALYYSLITTVWVVFGAIGAFCTGAVSNFFGRRNGLLFNNLFAIAGSAISAPAVAAEMPLLLYAGRALIGFNCGVTIGLASIYLTEIAPRSIRGAVGACHQLAVTLGILVAFLVSGLEQTLNRPRLWIVAHSLTALPALLSLLLLPLCPESPRFLFINRRRPEAAADALRRLFPDEEPQRKLDEMRKEMEAGGEAGPFRFTKLFTQPDLRMPLAIAVGIQIMQQLSGINAVMSYSTAMMEICGIGSWAIPYVNVGFSCFNVACTLASLPLLEKFGRRSLLLVPSAVLAGSLVVLFASAMAAKQSDADSVRRAASALFMACIFLYTAGFAFGLGTIPGFIVAELFRQQPRSAAYSLSQGVQWVSNLVVTTTFVNLNLAIEGYVFLIYLSVVAPFWIFFFFCMPETKNRSFDEVAKDLAFVRLCRGEDAQLIEDSAGDKEATSSVSLFKVTRAKVDEAK